VLPQSLFFSEHTTFETLSQLDANLGNNTQVLDDPPHDEVQHKVKLQMGETLWNELMANLSQFVKLADQLNDSK
jgi:hypothetical protein